MRCETFVLALVTLMACAHPQQPRGSTTAVPAAADPAGSTTRANARVGDETFALVLSAPETVRAGHRAQATLSYEGLGEYYVNEQYPVRVVPQTTSAVAFAHPELTAADAVELSKERAAFQLAFVCQAPGTHTVDVEVEFAVCTATACTPQVRRVEIHVNAR